MEINLGQKVQIEYFENPHSFYQNNTCADIKNSKEGLGYDPQFKLENGIYEYLKEIKTYTSNNWKSFNE